MVEGMVVSNRMLCLRSFKIGASPKVLTAKVHSRCLRPDWAIRLMAKHLKNDQYRLLLFLKYKGWPLLVLTQWIVAEHLTNDRVGLLIPLRYKSWLVLVPT